MVNGQVAYTAWKHWMGMIHFPRSKHSLNITNCSCLGFSIYCVWMDADSGAWNSWKVKPPIPGNYNV